jgi:enoyl-CoA hydratase/carnithine racemase
MEGDVAVIQLNRPERKNPLTFGSFAELRDAFRALRDADDVKAVVFMPHGGNFCSGGDVHDIIGPLVAMDTKGQVFRWVRYRRTVHRPIRLTSMVSE